MDRERVMTADELAAMSPAERRADFHASIVRDLSSLPSWYLAKVRARSAETIARRDAQQAAEGDQRVS